MTGATTRLKQLKPKRFNWISDETNTLEDGFLAPYKVVRISMDIDDGWRPEYGLRDKYGNEVEDRIYNLKDYDRTLAIDERTQKVAQKITEHLKATDRFAKTIVFCTDIDHANRMRQALINENASSSSKALNVFLTMVSPSFRPRSLPRSRVPAMTTA